MHILIATLCVLGFFAYGVVLALLAACKAVFCNHIPDAGKKDGE